MVAMLALTACSSNDDEVVTGAERQPLMLMAQTANAVTRAQDGYYTSTTGFTGGEVVRLFVAGSSANYTVGAAVPSDSYHSPMTPATENDRLFYPSGIEGTETVYAVYPSTSVTSHTVAYDQTGEAAYKASDLMYARKVVNMSEKTTAQLLTFNHQLVKMKFVITKAPDVEGITKVELKNVKRQATVAASTTGMTLSNITTATGTDAAQGDNILVLGAFTDNDPHTSAVVFPAQAWNNADFLVITSSNNETAVYQLTKNDWTPGGEYTMTLTVDASALGITASIIDWTAQGEIIAVPKNRFYIAPITTAQSLVGGKAEPTPNVYYNGTQLTAGTDFYYVYSNNTAAGTATVTVVGLNSYAGKTSSTTFTIN